MDDRRRGLGTGQDVQVGSVQVQAWIERRLGGRVLGPGEMVKEAREVRLCVVGIMDQGLTVGGWDYQ